MAERLAEPAPGEPAALMPDLAGLMPDLAGLMPDLAGLVPDLACLMPDLAAPRCTAWPTWRAICGRAAGTG
ncbi:hypothetical protein [Nonomuraea sp. NPDC003754]